MTELKPLRVLIAGGGIAGLSAAVALRLQGHEVEVFEKSRLNTELGNAVYCAPNCTAALSHLGVSPGDIGGVLNHGMAFMGADGKLQKTVKLPKEARAKWVAEWYFIARVDLHNALKKQATSTEGRGRPVKIHTACSVSSVDCKAATITTADGKTVHGDLFVGADGIHSHARENVLDRPIPLASTGTCCYRLLIPVDDLLADEETALFADKPGIFVQVTGKDRLICMYPCSSGKMMNVAAFVPRDEVGNINKSTTGTGYDQGANKKQLMNHFKSFDASVLRMLEKTPDDTIRLWDLLDMELQPSVVKDRAVLIGDAAHPFLPHMGQGAAQAIEDGCALGAVMPLGTTAIDVPERLELWQRLRLERVHEIVESTRHRARNVNGSQGPPQTMDEFHAAMSYCIDHDAWKHAEEGLEAWTGECGP